MPGMALSFRKLHNLPKSELIERYDEQAKTTVVGTHYYEEELARRDQEANTKAMIRLTSMTTYFTVIVTVATIVNVVVTVVG